MPVNYKVRLIQGPGLEEVEGLPGIIFGNVENGNLELYRTVDKNKKADLPFFSSPWQKISDFDVRWEGRLSKKKIMDVKLVDGKTLNIEITDNIKEQEILSDCIAFKKAAEQAHPKGGKDIALENLSKVAEALGEAFEKGMQSAKNKFSELKSKTDDLSKKVKK